MKSHAATITPCAPVRLETQAPIHELLAGRWSTRAFSDRSIGNPAITAMFEAARWAPSSANEQPWCFIAATKRDAAVYGSLFNSLTEGNRRWAAGAPVLILALARAAYSRTGKPNRYCWYDLGQSVASLVVQATAMGLSVHQMGGFDPEKVRRDLKIPEGYDPAVILAVGYPGRPESLPEDLERRERTPRSRRPLERFVFTEEWGKPSHLLQKQDSVFNKPSNN